MIRKELGLLLTTVLMALAAGAFPKLKRSLSEGVDCPILSGYPESRCQGIKNCPNIGLYIRSGNMTLNDVVGCGIGVFMELVCCPKEPPSYPDQRETMLVTMDLWMAYNYAHTSDPVVAPSEPPYPHVAAVVPPPEPYPHVAALQYLNPLTLDSYIFRCTGFLLQENFVLTSAACVGGSIADPNHVRLGLTAPFKGTQEIDNMEYYNNDLVLLHTSQGYGREYIAEICKQEDLDNRVKLMAVGFAQKNEQNCQWFEKELTNATFDSCDRVSNNRPVTNINDINHFCMVPKMDSAPAPGSCVDCLRGSASGLHVIRSDGSTCLAGIATPTSKVCSISRQPLYYTSLISPRNSDFLNGVLGRS